MQALIMNFKNNTMYKKTACISILLLSIMASLCAQSVSRMVFFNLKHEAGSPEAVAFFQKASVLKDIPALSGFQILQVEGKQFDYDYVIQLDFEDHEKIQGYMDHQIHKDFLNEEWKSNVSGGMLIDLSELPPNIKELELHQ